MANKGLPKKYAKMGFKKGWAEYKKTKAGRKSGRKSTAKTTPKRKRNVKPMARRKTSRRAKNTKIPLGITVGTGMALKFAYENWKTANDAGHGTDFITSMLTGYFPDGYAQLNGLPSAGFNAGHAIPFYGPMLGGYMVSKYIGGPKGLNLNASLKGVPLIKL